MAHPTKHSARLTGSRGEDGFSTVEVIAALVILSVALIPLTDILLSLRQNATRIAANEARMSALDNALDIVETLNVGEAPAGERDFGDWAISWQAQLVGDDTRFLQNQREIGLYDVTLTVRFRQFDGSMDHASYELRMVGWRETDEAQLQE